MAHTFTAILFHIIFSTKNRTPLIAPEIRSPLFPYMAGIIRNMKATPLLINGIQDHVHVLTSLPATIALSNFMQDLKTGSSGWVNDHFNVEGRFGWQTCYAAFSVSKSAQEDVRAYIARQEEHDRKMSFQEEYLRFLDRHQIQYDPRFVFDGTFVA